MGSIQEESWDRLCSVVRSISLQGDSGLLSREDLSHSVKATFRSHGCVTGVPCPGALRQFEEAFAGPELQSVKYESTSSIPDSHVWSHNEGYSTLCEFDIGLPGPDPEYLDLQRAMFRSYEYTSDIGLSPAEDLDLQRVLFLSYECTSNIDGDFVSRDREDVHLQQVLLLSFERQLGPGLVWPEDVDLQGTPLFPEDLLRYCTKFRSLVKLQEFVDALAPAWKDTNKKDTNGKDTNKKDTNGKDTNEKDTNGKDTNGEDTNGNPLRTEILAQENLERLLKTILTPGKDDVPHFLRAALPKMSLKPDNDESESSDGRRRRSRDFAVEWCFTAATGALLIAPFDPSGTMLILAIIATAGGLLGLGYQFCKGSKVTAFVKQAIGRLKRKKRKFLGNGCKSQTIK